jgi:hypothetical protein
LRINDHARLDNRKSVSRDFLDKRRS